MNLLNCSSAENKVIHQCLVAAYSGPFFPDQEFHTIFGLNREEIKAVLDKWPDIDLGITEDRLAVNNTLNNLTGHPHNMDKE